MARLKPGVSLAAAQAEVDSIEKGLRAAVPEFHRDNVRVVPLREHLAGSMRRPLLMLVGAVGFLFLIACANVTNLLLTRASHRRREIAIRYALGAGHGRVVRQLVTEALAFSCAGAALGTAAAFALVPLLKAFSPGNTPLVESVSLDERGLMFALLLTVAVGVLLGVVPAWERPSCEMNESLKSAGRNATEAPGSRRFKNVLVAVEFAVAMVLLTGAGLLIRSLVAVLSIEPGFQTNKVLTVQIGLPLGTPPAQLKQFYQEALQRVRTLPGVTAAGGISNLFFLNETRTHALRQVEGHAPEAKSSWAPLVWAQVAGEYFQAMGIPLLRGRLFDERDVPKSPLVAIVNETLARRYWPHEDAVGKHLRGFDPRGANDDWLTVVGVVADTRSAGRERAPIAQIYEVQAQRGEPIGSLVIRTAQSAGLSGSIRTVLHNLNPDTTIASIATLAELLGRQETQRRFQTWLMGVFSSAALALAMFGVFAVMHYSVACRRSEIGVRMALGAKPREIVRLILGGGMRVALCGTLAGLVPALWLTQLIGSMLYQVSPTDPISIAAAASILLTAAVLGSYAPARAALRVDPMGVLREE
jgi:putative ABC transport system permease protein